MKERPILFSAAMVRALLNGSKTQTRRVACKGLIPPQYVTAKEYEPARWRLFDAEHPTAALAQCTMPPCPYGQPGEQLWVKETHLPKASGMLYRADLTEFDAAGTGAMYGGWKPSIFMRREYSRITLRITGVRVERLQDISEDDAIAEGIEHEPGTAHWKNYDTSPGWRYWESPIQSYRTLWETINGPGSWDANPWVWVVEFNVKGAK
jgi:hypothetical protein